MHLCEYVCVLVRLFLYQIICVQLPAMSVSSIGQKESRKLLTLRFVFIILYPWIHHYPLCLFLHYLPFDPTSISLHLRVNNLSKQYWMSLLDLMYSSIKVNEQEIMQEYVWVNTGYSTKAYFTYGPLCPQPYWNPVNVYVN